MKRKSLLLFFVSVTVFCMVALTFLYKAPRKKYLVLSNFDTGKVIAQICFKDENSEKFSVSFIHSVNKSNIDEIYIIKGKDIYLDKCIYGAFGAGVATQVEAPQTLEYLADGSMLISGFDMKIDRLSYIVGTVYDHVLRINNEEINLKELCGKNTAVLFEVKEKI